MAHARGPKGFAGTLLIAAGLLSAAAWAGERDGSEVTVRSTAVSYQDLDLDSDAGVRALYERLAAAAERVCGPYDLANVGARRFWQACRADALAQAVQATGNPKLYALHESDRASPARRATIAALR